jgi:pimeloyl-ACP methyl ester carboxylesterase
MAHIKVNGINLYYEEHGSGNEAVVLAPGVIWDVEMFRAQILHLKQRFRVIVYDHRGTGQSDKPKKGLDMDSLAEDARELINLLGARPCHFVGHCMGGAVGLRLAARYPECVRSLTLLNTSAEIEPRENLPQYVKLMKEARWWGMWLYAGKFMPILFGRGFMTSKDAEVVRVRNFWRSRMRKVKMRTAFRSLDAYLKRRSIEDELRYVSCPTVVVCGDDDKMTLPSKGERIAASVRGADIVHIARAGHNAPVEAGGDVNAILTQFFDRVPILSERWVGLADS